MNTRSLSESVYLRFLQLRCAATDAPGSQKMDANEKALFDALALRWFLGQPLTVREAIHLCHLGSPATLHKRLKRLIVKNLVVSYYEGTDRRSKYLQPSEQGMAYIDWLGAQLLAACAH